MKKRQIIFFLQSSHLEMTWNANALVSKEPSFFFSRKKLWPFLCWENAAQMHFVQIHLSQLSHQQTKKSTECKLQILMPLFWHKKQLILTQKAQFLSSFSNFPVEKASLASLDVVQNVIILALLITSVGYNCASVPVFEYSLRRFSRRCPQWQSLINHKILPKIFISCWILRLYAMLCSLFFFWAKINIQLVVQKFAKENKPQDKTSRLKKETHGSKFISWSSFHASNVSIRKNSHHYSNQLWISWRHNSTSKHTLEWNLREIVNYFTDFFLFCLAFQKKL